MTCENIRQILLDLGLDEASRRRIADALAHLDRCEACRAAMSDFDHIVAILRPAGESDLTPSNVGSAYQTDAPDQAVSTQSDATPTGGWEAFGQRLQAVVDEHRRSQSAEEHLAQDVSADAPAPYRLTPDAVTGRGRFSYARWLPSTGALAASLLLAWIGIHFGSSPSAGVQPAPLVLAEDVIAQFHTMDQCYESRMRWLFLTPKAGPQIETTDGPSAPKHATPARNLMLVKLDLVNTGGEVVSGGNLFIVPGEIARFDVPLRDGPPLHCRISTSADDPAQLVLYVEAPTKNGDGVLLTSLQATPNRDVNVGRVSMPSGACDLKLVTADASVITGRKKI